MLAPSSQAGTTKEGASNDECWVPVLTKDGSTEGRGGYVTHDHRRVAVRGDGGRSSRLGRSVIFIGSRSSSVVVAMKKCDRWWLR